MNGSIEHDFENEPLFNEINTINETLKNSVIVSKSIIDMLLKSDEPGDTIALYNFLYYTGKWQKTNSIKAVTSFISKGLKWTERRTTKTKKILVQLGLITQFKRNSPTCKGWFIKINFLWTSKTIDNSINNEDCIPQKRPPVQEIKKNRIQDFEDQRNRRSSKSKIFENKDLRFCSTNALSINNLNSLNVDSLKATDINHDKLKEISDAYNQIRHIMPPNQKHVEDYFKLKKFDSSGKKYYLHYQSLNWMKGKNKITDWIANAHLWENGQTKFIQKNDYKDNSVINSALERMRASTK